MAAGEIGYMLLGQEFQRGGFQTEGAAEQVLSGQALISLFQENGDETHLDELFLAYEQARPDIIAVFEKVFAYFSTMLVNLVSVIDPQVIILSGRIGKRLYPYVKPYLQSMLERHVPYVPDIVCSTMNNTESIYGTISAALNYLDEIDIQTLKQRITESQAL